MGVRLSCDSGFRQPKRLGQAPFLHSENSECAVHPLLCDPDGDCGVGDGGKARE